MNISPASPAVALTSPDAFVDELFTNLGFFYTKGMPEETEALKDGVFDDDDYLAQVALVQQDTRRMVELALDRFAPGNATFVYLSDIDLQCHMLWRHGDPKQPDAPPHPARDPAVAARHAHDIERFYRDVDSRARRDPQAAAARDAAARDERPRLPALHAQAAPERVAARQRLPRAEGRQARPVRSPRATSTGRARAPTASASTVCT